jgi:hypothetical protein
MAEDRTTSTPGTPGPTPGTPAKPPATGSIVRAAAWMLALSVLLFWLPILGMFIAGLVGGRKAGGVGKAIVAAILPGLLLGATMALLATALTGMPLLGAIAGFGTVALVVANVVPLLAGAVVGGILS